MADNKLTKSVGEHWACSVLAGLGWAVALTRDGLARTDILAVDTKTSTMIEVQVKAASYNAKPSWIFGGAKALLPARTEHEWYVLVALPKCPWDTPRGFVVPRDHVAAGYWIAYQDWFTEPGVRPGKRNAPIASSHTFEPVFRGYENQWQLLSRPASEAPVLLPSSYRALTLSERVGLPDGHPWRADLPAW